MELKGEQEKLLKGLSRICSAQTGLTFAAKIYLSGQFEGRSVLYKADKYPFECIGPCRFMWNPMQDEQLRTLWIWIHPSIYKQIQEELIHIFELNLDSNDSDSPIAKRRKLTEEKESFICEQNNSKWSNENAIYLNSLKDKLNRFKLLGPLSTTILANVLKTALPESLNESLR